MSKKDLVEFIAKEADLTKVDAAAALEAFQKAVIKGLQDEGRVALVGFGSFNAKERAARDGRNPITGEPLKIPARVVASFKAGSKLKDALN